MKIYKNKNEENTPNLEIIEVILVHCNVVDNDFQFDLRVLYISAVNKNLMFLKTFNSEFSYIEIFSTYSNSKHLEIN